MTNHATDPSRSRGISLAALWMGGAIVSFLVMGIAARELSAELEPHHTAFYRSLACLLLLIPVVCRAGWRRISTRRFGRHLARNFLHFVGTWCWIFGVSALPFAEVIAIEFTSPIWTALLATAFLGERLTGPRVLAIALGTLGVIVILRPGLAVIDPASFVVLAAALGYACSYVLTKDLVRTDAPLTILWWMNAVQLPLGGALSIGNLVIPNGGLIGWVLALGVVGLSSHYCLSKALKTADVTLVVPLDFLRLPLAALLAWMLYAEAIDPFVFAGALLIVAGSWINLKRG